MKILFLDIDGVANCSTTTQRHRGMIGIDPVMAFLIGKITLDTGCKVVLSSSWRHSSEGVAEVERQIVPILDCTNYEPDDITRTQRGREIKAWLTTTREAGTGTCFLRINQTTMTKPTKTSSEIGMEIPVIR